MQKTAVIIVTYNAMKWAERCFSSLRKSSIPVNVIVVDNGSTDGTQDYVKTHFPEVEIIQSAENLGFGKANNIGIEKAYKNGADFFYLMNQDAWVFPDSIQELLNVYNSYEDKEEIGILSPMHLDGTEKNFDLHFERYLARCTEKNRLFSDLFNGNLKPYYEIDFVNAAHWFLPKKTVEEIGGFNTFIFHYGEDYEYVSRIKYYKKKVLLSTKSNVVHDAVQSFYKNPPKNSAEKLKQERVSWRKQRENIFLDPSYILDTPQEKKQFLKDSVAYLLKGQLDEAKFQYQMFTFFSKKFPEIVEKRKITMKEKNAFLTL